MKFEVNESVPHELRARVEKEILRSRNPAAEIEWMTSDLEVYLLSMSAGDAEEDSDESTAENAKMSGIEIEIDALVRESTES